MDNWFSAETSRYFAIVSVLALFAVAAPLAERGRGRRFIVTAWYVMFALGILSLGAAIVAWWTGQPGFVTRPLAVTGLVVTGVLGGVYGELIRAYQAAELRVIAARDL